jgi:hypothetical protein
MKRLLAPFSALRDWFSVLGRKLSSQRRYQRALVIFVTGLLLIIVPQFLEGEKNGSHALWVIVLLELGIACLIASVAEFSLIEHVKENFKQEVRQDMRIVSHCLEHQLVDILPSSNIEKNLAVQEISSTLERARDEIRVMVCNLQDILSDTFLRGTLNRLLVNDDRVEVQLLLLDPKSNAAWVRATAEGAKSLQLSQLYADLGANIRKLSGIVEEAKNKRNFKIEARFYDVLPHFYMISTKEDLFLEPCHLVGKRSIQENVPIFRFTAKSAMYDIAESHFKYVWQGPKKEPSLGKNGYIHIRTLEEVMPDFENRKRDRRTRKLPVDSDRRSSDSERRHIKAS